MQTFNKTRASKEVTFSRWKHAVHWTPACQPSLQLSSNYIHWILHRELLRRSHQRVWNLDVIRTLCTWEPFLLELPIHCSEHWSLQRYCLLQRSLKFFALMIPCVSKLQQVAKHTKKIFAHLCVFLAITILLYFYHNLSCFLNNICLVSLLRNSSLQSVYQILISTPVSVSLLRGGGFSAA